MIYAGMALVGYFVYRVLPQPESYILLGLVVFLAANRLIGGML